MAKLLGIFHIFCEPFLYSQPEYLQFLDKLEAELHLFDALFQKRPELRELHIRVQRYFSCYVGVVKERFCLARLCSTLNAMYSRRSEMYVCIGFPKVGRTAPISTR